MPTNSDPLKKLEELTKELHDSVERRGRNVFKKYPLTFALLTASGVVAVIYGFEGLVDQIPFLRDRPLLLLLGGIILLMFTGTLYKTLSR